MQNLQKMSDQDLATYKASFKAATKEYTLAENEFYRRLNRPAAIRSWVAICISALALVVSGIAVFIK